MEVFHLMYFWILRRPQNFCLRFGKLSPFPWDFGYKVITKKSKPMSDLTIAKTIREQLLAFGRIKVMSWGARGWTGGEDFLRFRVSARRHKGYVKITLNGMDLYDVELISMKNEVKDTINGLYFDQLADVIDQKIEYIPAYKS
jgi:hypothetical protein